MCPYQWEEVIFCKGLSFYFVPENGWAVPVISLDNAKVNLRKCIHTVLVELESIAAHKKEERVQLLYGEIVDFVRETYINNALTERQIQAELDSLSEFVANFQDDALMQLELMGILEMPDSD